MARLAAQIPVSRAARAVSRTRLEGRCGRAAAVSLARRGRARGAVRAGRGPRGRSARSPLTGLGRRVFVAFVGLACFGHEREEGSRARGEPDRVRVEERPDPARVRRADDGLAPHLGGVDRVAPPLGLRPSLRSRPHRKVVRAVMDDVERQRDTGDLDLAVRPPG